MTAVPLRIAHVVETLERGGLERMVCDLAAEQARQGWQVSVHCLFHRGLLAAELQDAGIEVTEAGKRSGPDLRALWRLRRALTDARPRLIHTHNAAAHYHTVAACRASRLGPLLNTRHGMGDAAASRVERRYQAALARTAGVVAVAQFARDHYVQQGIVPAQLLSVIPNGIRVERFAGTTRAAARAALGIDPHSLLVGTVGRLNWAKDQAVLIDALAALLPRHPQLRGVIVGDGALRAPLQAQIDALGLRERVQLLGDRGDVPALLPAFDVFALPSRTEGYSIALLEAAASGVPIVATDVGGNREIVQAGVTGVLAGGDFAAALGRLLDAPEERHALAGTARQWAAEHASVQAMAAQYARLYGRFIDEGAK